jgi:ankyrin repeat protein
VDGKTLLHWAAYGGDKNVEVVKFFVSLEADVSAKSEDGETPLHEAANPILGCNESIEVVKFLVSQGANVNANGYYGTPLHYAAQTGGSVAVVKFLVSEGSNVNARNKAGWSPLHFAVLSAKTEIVKFLVSQGANVNAKNGSSWRRWFGDTPLDLAKKRHQNLEVAEYPIIIEFLKSAGAR